MYVCMYVCIYIYIYTHTYTHTHVYTWNTSISADEPQPPVRCPGTLDTGVCEKNTPPERKTLSLSLLGNLA